MNFVRLKWSDEVSAPLVRAKQFAFYTLAVLKS